MKEILLITATIGIILLIIIAIGFGLYWFFETSEEAHSESDQKRQAEFYECLEKTEQNLDWCYLKFIDDK